MTQRIHISLRVSDLDRAVRFYGAMFGREPSKRFDDYANFRFDEPPIHLALVPDASGAHAGDAPGALPHYGVELGSHEALAAWRRRAEEAGLAPRSEEDVTCCYARADKFWLADPDGNAWEFWVRRADAPVMEQ